MMLNSYHFLTQITFSWKKYCIKIAIIRYVALRLISTINVLLMLFRDRERMGEYEVAPNRH